MNRVYAAASSCPSRYSATRCRVSTSGGSSHRRMKSAASCAWRPRCASRTWRAARTASTSVLVRPMHPTAVAIAVTCSAQFGAFDIGRLLRRGRRTGRLGREANHTVRPLVTDQEESPPVSDDAPPRWRRRPRRPESRWPPVAAVLGFVVLNVVARLWLPRDSILAVPWLLPTLEVGLLVVLLASDPLGVDRRARWLRRVATTLVLLMVAAALWSTAVLTDHIISGSNQTNSAGYLL